MQSMIDMYCKDVVQPIEDARKELIRKVYSKNIFCILNRKQNKELLKKYDELWMNSLRTLEKMLGE